jgi:uncharacterized protein (DUF433 family)
MTAVKPVQPSRLSEPSPRVDGDCATALSALYIYTLADAARLTQFCVPTVRRWAVGEKFVYKGEIRRSPGVIGCAPRWIGDTPHVTFRQLLSMRVVRGLRALGMPLKTIRRIAAMAAAESGDPVPLATLRFRTDGAAALLILDHARRARIEPEAPPAEDDPHETDSWQAIFADMLDRSLFRDVDWLDGRPVRWWPMGRDRSIVVDPRVVGGMPHVAGTRVRAAVIAADMRRWCDGEAAIRTVAAAHGITAQQLRDAVHFETVWLTSRDAAPVRSGSSPEPETPSAPSGRPAPSQAA